LKTAGVMMHPAVNTADMSSRNAMRESIT